MIFYTAPRVAASAFTASEVTALKNAGGCPSKILGGVGG
jgi:hypothetical protein